jgi:DNA-binding NtrC family response regulator
MSMRRAARGRASLDVPLRSFGWERAALAVLRHSTLPWYDGFAPVPTLDAVPLSDLENLGGRDKLSLVAQFAAHQAFLQFAGIADDGCDPLEWAVVQKRGCDVRLVRIAARASAGDAPPALTVIQQFAEAVKAPPLDVLKQSWARAESVYCEAEARLRRGAVADLRWTRRSAVGELTSPGIETLRSILAERGGRYSFRDPSCVDAIRNTAMLGTERVLVLGESASPLQRHSAIEPLAEVVGPLRDRRENEIVERVVAACEGQRLILVVPKMEGCDPASRSVLIMLGATAGLTWVDATASGATELPEARFLVAGPHLEPMRELERRITAWPFAERRAQIDDFAASPAFVRYLEHGELPRETGALARVTEPARSYLAAVSLLGMRIPRSLASRYLAELTGSTSAHDDLVIDGVTSDGDGSIAFVSSALREAALQLIPPASRPQLCRVAARVLEESGDLVYAAELLLDAGDELPPPLAHALANTWLDAGRYRDARAIAKDELTFARIERRLGEYASALARLEAMPLRDFDGELLRGELLFLMQRYDGAREAFAACCPATDDEHVRLGYARAVLAIECGEHDEAEWMLVDAPSRAYLVARMETYRSEARGDASGAVEAADHACRHARTVAEKIDALLDRVFALFSCGRWEESRAEAMRTLAVIEETQGDRAAGAVLFTLAYLCADDGQWAHAAQRIARLRHFYGTTHDERRLAELDLLAAHLDFSRARFDSARAAATALLARELPRQIREAAALIVDEIATLEGAGTPLLSTGGAGNRELADRHALLQLRRGAEAAVIAGDFTHALAAWERGTAGRPTPASGSEWLKLFRAALARGDRSLAESIAGDLGIELGRREEGTGELRTLHAASTRDFPFNPTDLGALRWRFAARNRLGHWNEIGSLPPLPAGELDAILSGNALDWLTLSDRELLYVDGISRWSVEGREALAAIVRTRAEQHRLQRIVAQDEATSPARTESIDGIVGDSLAMREVFALIARVAKRDVPVCILGESGTGKELVARAIHRHSPRRGKTFTAVNCAALPETLIESELFGQVRGAFTGADRDRAGLIETTDGGTLFLDEIGEMPLAAQAKLLRFLQEGEFRRVGEATHRTADVRVVTATNRKLESAVEEGRFREDLYYRIRVVEVVLPPLRERATDIPLLAAFFLAHEREKHRGGAATFTADAEAAVAAYAWPGNVRELQNTIRAAHALAGDAKAIDLEHLPERMRGAAGGRAHVGSYHDALARFRRELIERSLAQVMGNQNQAAALLKISRQALAYQIKELGILVRPS